MGKEGEGEESTNLSNELGRVLKNCTYALVDAVKAKKYVEPYKNVTLIVPDGLPNQDAANPKPIDRSKTLSEDFNNINSVTSIYTLGNDESKEIDPIMQIKDVVVVCKKINGNRRYLYYSK